MILRILPLLLLLLILPDTYIFCRFLPKSGMVRWLWWLPTLALLAYTICMASIRGFMPHNMSTINWYLLLMGLLVFPKVIFSLCSIIGWPVCKLAGSSTNYGNILGGALALGLVYIIIYGSTRGFSQLQVRNVDYTSSSVPKAFDGYKIVQFSDAHLPCFDNSRDILRKSIDAMLDQNADLIVFTGDLQNTDPEQIAVHSKELSRLKARDGVLTIMGNHDYADYVPLDSLGRRANVAKTMQAERDLGWRLLLNENMTVRRGNDSIVIAGEENWSLAEHFPRKGDLKKTLNGISDNAFLVMLSHDPTAWRHHILPVVRPAITLSGHTHGTQLSLFGWSPSQLVYDEWGGNYYDGESLLCVSTGFGGNFPFRFNMPREIVVITLHSK